VVLTAEQVLSLSLPPNSERAKRTSTNYPRFMQRYGNDLVYELEAAPPATLAMLLTDSIKSVLEIEAYNAEVQAERQDAAHIAAARQHVLKVLRDAGGLE